MKLRSRSKGIARVLPINLFGVRNAPLILVLFSLVMFSISAVNPGTMQGVRTRTADTFAPVIAAANKPFYQASEYVRVFSGLAALQEENARLRAENMRLKEWYQTALSLQAENGSLQKLLNIKLDPMHHFVTARVISDSGNAFAKSLLVMAGKNDDVHAGQAVLGQDGLAGRVIESGNKTSRILLLTDINSRIPVIIQGTNQRAVMAGNNEDLPVLLHLPPELKLEPGTRVITSGHGGMFPYGLPVGKVVLNQDGNAAIEPFVSFDRINIVRIVSKADDPHLKQGLR